MSIARAPLQALQQLLARFGSPGGSGGDDDDDDLDDADSRGACSLAGVADSDDSDSAQPLDLRLASAGMGDAHGDRARGEIDHRSTTREGRASGGRAAARSLNSGMRESFCSRQICPGWNHWVRALPAITLET